MRLLFSLTILLAFTFNSSFALSGGEGGPAGVDAAFAFGAETQTAVTSSGQIDSRPYDTSIGRKKGDSEPYNHLETLLVTDSDKSSDSPITLYKLLQSIVDTDTATDVDGDGIPDSEDSSIVTVDVNFPNVSISIERTDLADEQAIVWSDLRLFSPSGCMIGPSTEAGQGNIATIDWTASNLLPSGTYTIGDDTPRVGLNTGEQLYDQSQYPFEISNPDGSESVLSLQDWSLTPLADDDQNAFQFEAVIDGAIDGLARAYPPPSRDQRLNVRIHLVFDDWEGYIGFGFSPNNVTHLGGDDYKISLTGTLPEAVNPNSARVNRFDLCDGALNFFQEVGDADGDGALDAFDAFPENANEFKDTDSDSVGDNGDAFPNDPAASVDIDGDGHPDSWNVGASDELVEGSDLSLDAFPNDPAASVDTDGDGAPDAWNEDATDEQIASSALVLDLDDDGDGYTDEEEIASGSDPLGSDSNPSRPALNALYAATFGDSWTNNTGWNTETNECTWFGVTCNDDGRVTALDLAGNNVRGPLPASIGDLYFLERLALNQNPIGGQIPAEIGSLSELKELYLGLSGFTGRIPAEVGNLSKLEYLNFNYNGLFGELPAELGNLRSLRLLALTGNDLSGAIPASLGQLSSLIYLYINENGFSGTIPSELGNLQLLQTLGLHFNQLTGSIPDELTHLTSLVHLYLYNNRLSGPIPEEIGNLRWLDRIFLHDNQLTGEIPDSIVNLNLDRLFAFNVDSNDLSGVISEDVGSFLAQLGTLGLRNNRFECPYPSALESYFADLGETCRADTDQDGLFDDEDAFPNDPAASVDTDGDGFPDEWNEDATDEQIASSELVLDAFPNDTSQTSDTDGDGYSDETELASGSDPLDPKSVPETEYDGLPIWLKYWITKP